ncbi:intraflagellar transport protein 57 homolog isoform X1 [Myzus persicae]|uniref:intraflagellar transport protein 57 homolog isoform X1 n=2 Tax=Myzus persicae TaxID=13164 RepID=UPI000B937C03|nr:intraflagellar transport protein 57 homolog isoform X1 [Myzus persicae]XP_022171689.1 intraflagellar transport protein 57 homolog isoform X1 [Myzus persicae]
MRIEKINMDIQSVDSSRSRSTNRSETVSYQHFLDMEILCDRLILLDYESYVVKSLKMRPINRHYFALQTSSGEQFYMFVSLAIWLLSKLGKDLKQPQEYDDPNSTVNSILESSAQLELSVDFPVNQLKQGFGKHVIEILNGLADLALKKNNFPYKKPIFPVEKEEIEELPENNAELLLEHVEEEMVWTDSDSDEENMLNINDLTALNKNKRQTSYKTNENLKTTSANKEEWNLELEQVLPSLRVTIKLDYKDWRTSLKQMKEHKFMMNASIEKVKPLLTNLCSTLGETMEKVYSREQYLNSSLDNLLIEYRNSQDELARVIEHYKLLSNGIVERQDALLKITEQLDIVKQEMDERGSSMTDGTPLINIKKAIATIRSDIMEMDVRIGVLQHGYFMSKVHEKSVIQDPMIRPIFPRTVL